MNRPAALSGMPRKVTAAAPPNPASPRSNGATVHRSQDGRSTGGDAADAAHDDPQSLNYYPMSGPHGEPRAPKERQEGADQPPAAQAAAPPRRREPVFLPPGRAEPLAPRPGPPDRSGVIEFMPQLDDAQAEREIRHIDETGALPDTAVPSGPDADRMLALLQARVRSGDDRRAAQGRPPRDAGGNNYVLKASTQAEYVNRGKSLFARYKLESGSALADEDVDPRDFVNWLFSLKLGVKSSTWRLYRAAALTQVQSVPHDGVKEAVAILDADVGVGADEARAAQHGRRFDKNDFDLILESLRYLSRSDAVPWLKDWMVATINTGLRPSEWALAGLEVKNDPARRRVWLHIVNARAGFDQSNGVYRTIDISDFSDDARAAVQAMVDRSAAWAFAQETLLRQSQCAQVLYQVCATLFPRQQRHSLYSLRHQFIANMTTIYGPGEIAALVGHVTNETAVEHYSKRRTAWQQHHIRDVPIPMPDQVAQMRKRLKMFDDRRTSRLARRDLIERRAAAKAKNEEL